MNVMRLRWQWASDFATLGLAQVARNPLQTEALRGSFLEALEHLRQSGAIAGLKAGRAASQATIPST